MSAMVRFEGLCGRLGVPWNQVTQGWFNVLAGLYNEPHRHYHGERHILNLLDRLHALKPNSAPGMDRFLEAEVAIWFHDAVYVVGSRHNEEASALLARGFLWSLGVTDTGATNQNHAGAFLDAVNEAILATKHDGREAKGNGARVMVDLDLAGFADPWDEFEENNRRIRLEYAAVPEEKYRWGRAAFLTALLNRQIYTVLTDLEEPARANIKRHVADLIARAAATPGEKGPPR